MPLQSVSTTPSIEAAIEILDRAVALARDPQSVGESVARLDAQAWHAVPMPLVRERLDALLIAKNPEAGLDTCQAAGLFAAILPEVEALVGFGDGEWRHKDVWKHTKLVVRQSVPRLEVRWGALLHDIGKPRTRKIEDDGSVTFYGHAELGAAMFRRKVRARLGFEPALAERIHFLILHHLRASQYETGWTDSAVRRFYVQMGDGLKDLLDLSRADITTKRPEKRRRGVRQIAELGRRIRTIASADARTPALPKGIGNMLTEAFSIPPSKRLGDVRKQLEQDVEEGLAERGRDCDYYQAFLAENRSRYGLD